MIAAGRIVLSGCVVALLSAAGCGGSARVDEEGSEAGKSDGSIPDKCDADGDAPTVLADNQRAPLGIAVDQHFVYWANVIQSWPPPAEAGTIMRAPKAGGGVIDLATDLVQPARVALHGDNVYWVTNQGLVGRTPKDGGLSQVLATGEQFLDVAVDEGHVYAADPLPGAGAIVRVNLANGEAETLAGNGGAWAASTLAVDEGHIYWADAAVKRLMTASKVDLLPQVLFEAPSGGSSAPGTLEGLAVDAQNVYWAAPRLCGSADGSIMSIAKEGGTPNILVSNRSLCGANLAVDGTSVFWTEPDEGRVMKAPKTGGEPKTVACGQALPVEIAIDDDHVYWTNAEGGTVMRSPK